VEAHATQTGRALAGVVWDQTLPDRDRLKLPPAPAAERRNLAWRLRLTGMSLDWHRPSVSWSCDPAGVCPRSARAGTHARTGTGTAPPGDRPPLFGAKTSTGLSTSKAAGARRVADAPRGSRRVL